MESLKLNLRNECRSTIFYKLFLTPELVFNMTTATTPKELGKYVIIVEKSHVKPRLTKHRFKNVVNEYLFRSNAT